LLYVAATRAKRKLIINGHLTAGYQRLRASGWLNELLEAAGMDVETLDLTGETHIGLTPAGRDVGVQVVNAVDAVAQRRLESQTAERPVSAELPLFQPLPVLPEPAVDMIDSDEPVRLSWRIADQRSAPAAEVVGRLVHRALQRWLFPDDPALNRLMESLAAENGLTDPRQKKICLHKVFQLLNRLRDNSLWVEVSNAQARFHEVPYTRPIPGHRLEAGTIDLLYKDKRGWHLIDFKTEELTGDQDLKEAIRKHSQQLQRYRQAVRVLLGPLASARLCFLDAQGQVKLSD